MTVIRPRTEPPAPPPEPKIDLTPCNVARVCGVVVIAVTLVLYAIFW
jgi:hypothetical protein